MKWLMFYLSRPYRRCVRLMKLILLGLVLLMSPFIAWAILAVNREVIHYIVNALWIEAYFPGPIGAIREDVNSRWFISGFNEAALGGLLTLYGVIVTVWYYHITRQQVVVEKRLFIIEEILEELKKNRRILNGIEQGNFSSPLLSDMRNEIGAELTFTRDPKGECGGLRFNTKSWEKLGADVALLPRRIHMRLSVLYSCLAECACVADYNSRRAIIERIPDIIAELHRYRSKLSREDIG